MLISYIRSLGLLCCGFVTLTLLYVLPAQRGIFPNKNVPAADFVLAIRHSLDMRFRTLSVFATTKASSLVSNVKNLVVEVCPKSLCYTIWLDGVIALLEATTNGGGPRRRL